MPTGTAKKANYRGGTIKGVIYGIVLITALLAVYAAVIKNKPDWAQFINPVLLIINLLGAFICGLITSKTKGNNKMLNGIISGAVLAAVIIMLALICCETTVDIMKSGEILLISLCGSAIGARLNLCKSNKKLRFRSNGRKR